jgi:hypothetical protein
MIWWEEGEDWRCTLSLPVLTTRSLTQQVSRLQVNKVIHLSMHSLTCACNFLRLDPIYHHISVGSYLPSYIRWILSTS